MVIKVILQTVGYNTISISKNKLGFNLYNTFFFLSYLSLKGPWLLQCKLCVLLGIA
jgi:hypothetical protein